MNMKKEWNERAEKNAFHYVSTFRENWDSKSFYEYGEVHTRIVIDQFLKEQSFDPTGKTVLEIGCGAGRMSQALASRFKVVYAYDVSDKYIEIAKANNIHKNIIFQSNDGVSFPELDDKSVDFVFSGWVMGHMPTKEVVTKNIQEIARVLKEGGIYKIDPLTTKDPMFRELAMSRFAKPILSYLVKDKLKLSKTYIGVRFKRKEMAKILSKCGLSSNIVSEIDSAEKNEESSNRNMRRWFYGKRIMR